ncbi:MAG: PAS domain S-box protein [Nitrospirota bacterium]|nr:MAG: PAS domain S-box protein [Nitrospirota bacterium]
MSVSSPEDTPPSVLVVDSDPDIGVALKDLLTNQGYDVLVVDRGSEAITAVKEQKEFSTVLLDMELPDVDGLTVLQTLIELDARLPVIALTAYGELAKTVGALELGAFAYLKKPYNKEELKTTLVRAIAVKDLTVKAERVEQKLTKTESRLRSERKFAEHAVRESEGRLQAILDGSSAVIYVKDLQGRYLLINREYESLFELDREEVKGQTDYDIFPKEIADAFRKNDQMVLKAGRPLQSEEIAPHEDGHHFYVSNKFPLRNAEGKIYAVCGISTDITERKRAEKALQESEERFRQVVEIIKEVFWLSNPEKTQILYVSPGYETIWGRSCESLYASPRTWLDAIHSEDRGRVLEAALTKQLSGDYDETYRIVRPDGSIRWIRDRAFPVSDKEGTVYRIAGIAEDITGQR